MFKAKENFLDRMEQSFIVLKNNAKELLIPYILFNLFTLVLLPAIFFNIIIGGLGLDGLFSGSGQAASIIISLFVTGGIFILILYAIVLIPFQVGMLFSVKQALAGEQVTFIANVKSCFPKILQYMLVYWYIFAYTLLIPALIFIVGGFFMIGGMLMNSDFASILSFISGVLIVISVIIGLYFMIYRGVKASFGLVSSVETGTISKETFSDSLEISDGKWFRLLWNFVGVGLIGGLLIGLVSGLGNAIAFAGTDFSEIMSADEEITNFADTVNALTEFNIAVFLNQAFQNILGTILGVYITIFSYILYKRLVDEHGDSHNGTIEKPVEKVVLIEQDEL